MARRAQRNAEPRRLVVAITGATGAAYGVRLLDALRAAGGWQSHLVLSDAGALNAWHELGLKRRAIERMADVAYAPKDIGAAIASGSFLTEGMIIAPCSMKTLAAVAHAHADDLVARAADVVLKERRRLVLLPRETPLTLAHLRNMVAVTEMGGIVFPPVPAFYARPKTIAQLVDHTVGRALDLYGIRVARLPRWRGMREGAGSED
ncbi:MAG: UbiX family flavin prenyltransferase [Burkholderiales bacterium]|nr:UbiX family flavin prenyltransferase [Burkholderiales bacterium]